MSSATPMEMADALLRDGRVVEAEELMAQGVREAEATTGRDSPGWAAAQSDLGNVLLNSHQLDRALACYRAAAADTPVFVELEARKDQLTYRTNLGLALQCWEGSRRPRRNCAATWRTSHRHAERHVARAGADWAHESCRRARRHRAPTVRPRARPDGRSAPLDG